MRFSGAGKIEPSIIDSPEQNVCALQAAAGVCSHCFIRHLNPTPQKKDNTVSNSNTSRHFFSPFEVNKKDHLNGIDKSKHSSLSF